MNAAAFEAERGRLTRLAYRMTGVMAEAEDLVQETYLRFHAAGAAGEIRNVAAWATTALTRLAIDHLRSRKRTAYVGPWLPEPLLDEAGDDGLAAARIELADDLSLAFLMVMEALPPAERAAFLLHDAFGHDHGAVAAILGKSEAAVRQLVSRGRARLKAARPEIHAPKAARDAVAGRFIDALMRQDGAALLATLGPEAVLYSDGGGKRKAALNPIFGADRILRFFAGIARKVTGEVRFTRLVLNGDPGLAATVDGAIWFALVPVVRDDCVAQVLMMVNPDKLAGVAAALTPGPGSGRR
ncbi:RNA polymerase sigma factor SigJ [Zavarzinia sp.]|uniref:RNA polymerase sigma factor SigJ n=1 Tax=Zavarzinia sp. TaxID=2027920 RepID=UPI0035623F7B